MKRKDKIIVVLMIGIILITVLYGIYSTMGTMKTCNNQYELARVEAKCIKISEKTEVRSEPVVLEERGAFAPDNSFGKVSETGFSLIVTNLYEADVVLGESDRFIGINVDDIMSAPERRWFPRELSSDPDGIVWIDSRCVEIIA